MPYIGSSASPLPVNFAAVQAQSFNGTGSQTAFTLSRTVPSAASIEVLVNNVQQSPYDGSYSVSGTTLTFSEAPSSGTNNVYVVYRDQSLGSLVDAGAVRKTDDAGAALMPVGTTAQRPASPVSGMIRQNSTTGLPEWYDAARSQWIAFSDSSYQVEYLVVAGGGGGGQHAGGGGGGAGGVANSSVSVMPTAAYSITIGAGGTSSSSEGAPSTAGTNSVLSSLATAIGGGRGGYNSAGGSGGSGGGGGSNGAGGSGTSGQGSVGGSGVFQTGAGGGGAGAVGANASGVNGGAGGAGLNWQSLGTFYAGGGGGGAHVINGLGGSGGSGGGGAGAPYGTSDGISGNANTGGGGGGSGGRSGINPTAGGAGGSGIVIIRYLGAQRGTGGTVTSSGGYTIHTFTSSGTFTA